MKKITYTLLLLLGISNTIFTQNITSTFRGTIKDSKNQQPLTGATVHIFSNQFSAGDVTDSLGNFKITDVNIGRFEVEINFLGYNTLVLSEVLIEAGKEQVMDIVLEESFADLQEIVVKANSTDNTLSPISNHLITIEEVERFPATFFDPARLAMLYPGVTGTNDQANGLSIRGLPPSLLQWRLEGVEIVNPNHLSNAGTISDQPSVAAGGVNILSAQMLDNSRLYTGAFPVEYSNALGGVMDMRLRKGNNQQHEFTAQAGLLGFDLGMEGPFSKKSKASFLFNYRYSFTGLLTNFGVDFDGESIGFEDVSFNLNFPTEKMGEFMVFGIGGKSDNFKKQLPMEEWEVDKDRNQIDFDSKVGIGGVKHQIGFRNTVVETAIVYSGLHDERVSGQLNSFEDIDLKKEKLSINHKWIIRASPKSKFVWGAQYLRNKFFNQKIRSSSFSPDKQGQNDIAISSFVSYTDIWYNKLIFNIGYNFVYRSVQNVSFRLNSPIKRFTFNSPTFSLQLPIRKNASISYHFGVRDGLFPIVYRNAFETEKISSYILQYNLNYELFYKNKIKLKAEVFFQNMQKVPVLNNRFDNNVANEDILPFNGFENIKGSHNSIGLELFLQRFFTDKSYFLVSATMYNSNYSNPRSATDKGKYNSNFIFNSVWGKEISKHKENFTKTFGFNVRGIIRNGFRERELTTRIAQSGNTVPVFSDDFRKQLPPYFRIDLRFYLRKNTLNRTNTLSLDIQNATNHQNVAYNYFDTFSREIKTQYQLGLIPLLNYRIEF